MPFRKGQDRAKQTQVGNCQKSETSLNSFRCDYVQLRSLVVLPEDMQRQFAVHMLGQNSYEGGRAGLLGLSKACKCSQAVRHVGPRTEMTG